jgi:hypothetical protein
MPRIISLLLFFCIAAGLSCQPTRVAPSSLTGKLVIDGPCGNYVIQVLQGTPGPGRVVASWKDTLSNTVYTNVFTVSNQCHFPGSGSVLNKGDVFTFEWDGNPPANNCMVCEIYVPTPPVHDAVKNIQKIK